MIYRLRRKVLRVAMIIAVVATPMSVVFGAMNVYLEIAGIPGESTDSTHTDWIDILSFEMEVIKPVSSIEEGRQTGSSVHPPIIITKRLDVSTPKLMLKCCSGEVLSTVRIEFVQPAGNKIVFYKITLTNVIISSVRQSGTSTDDDVPSEEFTLDYGTIQWSYTEIDDQGDAGATTESQWDRVTATGQ